MARIRFISLTDDNEGGLLLVNPHKIAYMVEDMKTKTLLYFSGQGGDCVRVSESIDDIKAILHNHD